MKILQTEKEIKCNWFLEAKKVISSIECDRIEWLRKNHLVEITRDNSEWLVLYQDPEDKRFWELTYLQSELHGGGPPSLINITEEEVKNKYNL